MIVTEIVHKRGQYQHAPPPSPFYQFAKEKEEEEEKEKFKWEEVSAMIKFLVQVITDMREAHALEKAWLVGRGVGKGETPNYGYGIYGDGDNGK